MQRAVFKLDAQDFHDVLEREGFKIEAIRGVVIRRNCFGVTVDHDRFIPRVGQRVAGVAAAVIKLDPLTNTVRTTAKNNNFVAIGRAGFAFHIAESGCLVGGVHVGRLRLEFGSTCVDAFEDGCDADGVARFAHVFLFEAS